jgi:hypothetical protein
MPAPDVCLKACWQHTLPLPAEVDKIISLLGSASYPFYFQLLLLVNYSETINHDREAFPDFR